MVFIPAHSTSRLLLAIFTAGSILLFGFIALKPEALAAITPFKPCNAERLALIYRCMSIVVLVGTLANLLMYL